MSTLVINRQSISVKLEANHLVLHEHADGESFRRVPLVDVDRVIIVGQPAVTFPVLAKLMDMGIPCSFLTSGGRWRGVMDGDFGFHAGRRMRQYRCVKDGEIATRLTRRLVAAKIANCRRTLQRLTAERDVKRDCRQSLSLLKALSGNVAVAKDLDSIRGIEGLAAGVYFGALSEFFPEDAPFKTRTRRPPRDAANALLSFSYVLLANVFVAAIRSHGLDVAGGFFHRATDRSPSLALDLMEPFRPVLADRFVLGLLNHRRVRADEHFETDGDGGVSMSEQGRKIVFMAFDEMMARRVSCGDRKVTVRQLIDNEVCRFIKVVDEGSEMRFYKAA